LIPFLNDLSGGITRYKPIRVELLLRDAIHAAENRIKRIIYWNTNLIKTEELQSVKLSSNAELLQIKSLLKQSVRTCEEIKIEYRNLNSNDLCNLVQSID